MVLDLPGFMADTENNPKQNVTFYTPVPLFQFKDLCNYEFGNTGNYNTVCIYM